MSPTSDSVRQPKDFDAVAMKRAIQSRVAAATAGLSAAERLAWFRQRIADSEFADFLDQQGAPSASPAPRPAPEP